MPGVQELRERGVRGVILSYVDTAGVNRVKAVPLARLDDAVRWGVGMSPVFDVFLANDSSATTDKLGSPDGDLRLRPDVDRLVVLAGQPGWAWAPADRYTEDGEPWIADQRGFARRMVDRAGDLTFRMGIEVEWAVGHSSSALSDEFVPACRGPAYGMTRLVELSDYIRDVMVACEDQGLQVEQIHPEYAAGQFEISVAAADPVRAADDSILVRQTIRAVSHRYGLRPSFSPAVVAGRVGNGGHVHVSVWRGGVNLFTAFPYGLAGRAAAGILGHLPALLAVGAPTPASYLRLVPSRWAGAYACWGVQTRETALRFVPGTRGLDGAANLEVKCVDLAANPYLLVGALIAAVLDGIEAGAVLPPPVSGDPVLLPDAPRLPTTLDEATDAFAGNAVLRAACGDVLSDAIVAVRRAEADRFRDTKPEDVAAALRWVY